MRTTAVLGASSKPYRYSNKAMKMLAEYGYDAIPVTPNETSVCGKNTVSELSNINDPVDTVTLYVNPAHLRPLVDQIIKLGPRRVIMNPGTDSSSQTVALRWTRLVI